MNEKVFMDQYQKNFLNEEEFIDFLQEREENSAWQREKNSEIRFLAADDQKVTMFMENEENHEMQPIMEDTMEHTRLVLKVQDSFYPVRSCAVKTILDRARVSGNALNKVEKTVLAKILNYCMEVASGEALLRFCEKKISAVHGGDPSDYAVLEMPELFRKTVEYLQTNFPGYTFAGASYDHSVATALWELSNETDLLQEYRELLEKHHLPTEGLKAGLRLTTSDVGYSGANLYPLLFVGSGAKILPLGSPLKLEHKNGASLEKFDSQLNLLYAQYGKALSNLEKMMSLILLHPVNAMLGVMKRIGIPKKIAMEVAENFQQQNGETCCSAYEVYLGITEAEHILMRDEPEGAKIVKMEENIARAVHIRWKDYDLAGEMKW